jgi:hypothetical protein
MSSELVRPSTPGPVSPLTPVPRTAVPVGLVDPVAQARAELKAALAAIEDKANVARRANRAADRLKLKLRAQPVLAAVVVVTAAAAAGAIVWTFVRSYTR